MRRRAFSPPDRAETGVSAFAPRKAEPRRPGAGLGDRRVRHARRHVVVGGGARAQLVELVLREIGDVHLAGSRDLALQRREAPADELAEGRLAVAVGAEQGDAVVRQDGEVEPVEDGPVAIARGAALDGDERRREQPLRARAGRRAATSSSTMAAIGSSLASRLTRDCACRAFDALARKRSTKACRCLRSASCFTAHLRGAARASRRTAARRTCSRRDRA